MKRTGQVNPLDCGGLDEVRNVASVNGGFTDKEGLRSITELFRIVAPEVTDKFLNI